LNITELSQVLIGQHALVLGLTKIVAMSYMSSTTHASAVQYSAVHDMHNKRGTIGIGNRAFVKFRNAHQYSAVQCMLHTTERKRHHRNRASCLSQLLDW
jgi:hypothetical protein